MDSGPVFSQPPVASMISMWMHCCRKSSGFRWQTRRKGGFKVWKIQSLPKLVLRSWKMLLGSCWKTCVVKCCPYLLLDDDPWLLGWLASLDGDTELPGKLNWIKASCMKAIILTGPGISSRTCFCFTILLWKYLNVWYHSSDLQILPLFVFIAWVYEISTC